METNLNLFYNEEANVTIRTQQVNDEPWFVAKDVVAALGIGWNGTTLASIPDEWKGCGLSAPLLPELVAVVNRC